MGKPLTASEMGKRGGANRAKALTAAERRRIAGLGGKAKARKSKK